MDDKTRDATDVLFELLAKCFKEHDRLERERDAAIEDKNTALSYRDMESSARDRIEGISDEKDKRIAKLEAEAATMRGHLEAAAVRAEALTDRTNTLLAQIEAGRHKPAVNMAQVQAECDCKFTACCGKAGECLRERMGETRRALAAMVESFGNKGAATSTEARTEALHRAWKLLGGDGSAPP